VIIFETERLIMRNYRDEDRPVFAAIAGNPLARIYHLGVITPAGSDDFIDKQMVSIAETGCGYAVVERKADGVVIGDVGIRPLPDNLPFSDEVHFEIGWQLDPRCFGNGYATEAAKGWLDHGFSKLRIDEVVAYTATANTPSVNVMKRIGMIHDPSREFDHPRVPNGHPLRRQIVYSVRRGTEGV
jgi:RimJ/RimL family protein N-acetyltransferase